MSTNNPTSSENRTDRYSFRSQKDVEDFFADTFPRKYIKDIIKLQKSNFVFRPDTSKAVNKMQFLKKCEWELVRLAKEKIQGTQNS